MVDYNSYPTIVPGGPQEEEVPLDPALLEQTIPGGEIPIDPQLTQHTIPVQPVPVPVPTQPAQAPTTVTVTTGGTQPQQQAPVPQPSAVPQKPQSAPQQVQKPTNPNAPLSEQQYLDASLGNLGERAALVDQGAQIEAEGADAVAGLQDETAQLKDRQLEDQAKFYQMFQENHDREMQRLYSAYADLDAKAGKLKDPTDQYYEDKGGISAKLVSGLAAFASGLGAGILGSASNPVLEMINSHINANFEANKQNIRDLYEKQVAAGKIVDTVQNRAIFQQDMKLKNYELEISKAVSKLEAIKAKTTSQLVRNAADVTKNGLQQDGYKLRNDVFKEQAAIAAKAKQAAESRRAAQQARLDKETEKAQEFYIKGWEKAISEGASPEDASIIAARAVTSAGFSPYATASLAQSSGGVYNPDKGQFDYPETKPLKGKQSAETEKKLSAIRTLDQLTADLSKLPKTVYTPESLNWFKRLDRSVKDWESGEGAYEKQVLTPEQREATQAFLQARQMAISMGSAATGQGSLTNPETAEAVKSLQSVDSPELLIKGIERLKRSLEAGAGVSASTSSSKENPTKTESKPKQITTAKLK